MSVVAFDHCITSVQDCDAPAEFSGSDEDIAQFNGNRERANSAQSRLSKQNSTNGSVTYRFGSVGQDTTLLMGPYRRRSVSVIQNEDSNQRNERGNRR